MNLASLLSSQSESNTNTSGSSRPKRSEQEAPVYEYLNKRPIQVAGAGSDLADNFQALVAQAGPLAALQHLLARTQLLQPATARSQFPLNQLSLGLSRQISGAMSQPRQAIAPRPSAPPSFGVAQSGIDYQGRADEAHRRKIQGEQERMSLHNMFLNNRGVEQQQALNYRKEDRSQQLFNGLLNLFSKLSSGGGGL